MSEDSSNLIRQFVRDVFIHHRLDMLNQLLAEDFSYISDLIKESKDRLWLKDMLQQIFTAFPDFTMTIESFNNKDNLISLKVTISGTLENDFMGIKGQGQHFSSPGVMIFEVVEHRIKRIQAKLDTAHNLQQLKKAMIAD